MINSSSQLIHDSIIHMTVRGRVGPSVRQSRSSVPLVQNMKWSVHVNAVLAFHAGFKDAAGDNESMIRQATGNGDGVYNIRACFTKMTSPVMNKTGVSNFFPKHKGNQLDIESTDCNRTDRPTDRLFLCVDRRTDRQSDQQTRLFHCTWTR